MKPWVKGMAKVKDPLRFFALVVAPQLSRVLSKIETFDDTVVLDLPESVGPALLNWTRSSNPTGMLFNTPADEMVLLWKQALASLGIPLAVMYTPAAPQRSEQRLLQEDSPLRRDHDPRALALAHPDQLPPLREERPGPVHARERARRHGPVRREGAAPTGEPPEGLAARPAASVTGQGHHHRPATPARPWRAVELFAGSRRLAAALASSGIYTRMQL